LSSFNLFKIKFFNQGKAEKLKSNWLLYVTLAKQFCVEPTDT